MIEDRFISGMHNARIQTDLLAMSVELTTYASILQRAEHLEAAHKDHEKMTSQNDPPLIARVSMDYRRSKKQNAYNRSNNTV